MLSTTTRPQADERDAEIMARRLAKIDAQPGPRVGDWVRFADGEMRRFTYHWGDAIQITDRPGDVGSFYLGEHGCSYSGALDPGVPVDTLTLTDETLPGRVWIFHHDWHTAHNGVTFTPDFRVFACSRAL